MRRREIEQLLNSALEKTAPDNVRDILSDCGEQNGRSVIIMTEAKKKKPVLKIAVTVAAAALIMAVTVTAVNFTGLMDESEAFATAYNHLYNVTPEGQDKTDIGNLILSGMASENGIEMGDSDIGLKGVRPVYRLSFTLLDTVYRYTIDAKTGVVYEWSSEPVSESEYAPKEHETHPFEISEAEKNAAYNRTYALNAAVDHFGLYGGVFSYPDGDSESYVYFKNDVYSSEEGYYEFTYWGGGYEYSCKVSMETGEVYDAEISDDELYEGTEEQKVKAEPIPGVIGLNAALKIACEELGVEYTLSYCGDSYLGYADYIPEGKIGISLFNEPTYRVFMNIEGDESTRIVYVEPKTGEVLAVTQYENEPVKYYDSLTKTQLAICAVRDRFGLVAWVGPGSDGNYIGVYAASEFDEDGNILVVCSADGYVYKCSVDGETLDILSESVEEDSEWTGKRIPHEPDAGMIGFTKAVFIAAEHSGMELNGEIMFSGSGFIDEDGKKYYTVHFSNRNASNQPQSDIRIDCYTGEVVREIVRSHDPTSVWDENEVPDTEAPDGMISEAAALTSVLDELGITETPLRGLKFILDGDEYVIKFALRETECEYRVSAKSGKVTSAAGIKPEDIISAETAVENALKDCGLTANDVQNPAAELSYRNSFIIYDVTYLYEGNKYGAEVDAVSGEIMCGNFPTGKK